VFFLAARNHNRPVLVRRIGLLLKDRYVWKAVIHVLLIN
jgi:hypothetical protein